MRNPAPANWPIREGNLPLFSAAERLGPKWLPRFYPFLDPGFYKNLVGHFIFEESWLGLRPKKKVSTLSPRKVQSEPHTQRPHRTPIGWLVGFFKGWTCGCDSCLYGLCSSQTSEKNDCHYFGIPDFEPAPSTGDIVSPA